MKKKKNGLYIGDTWETFLAQRDRLPNWKIPLCIAAVLHLAVFTGAAVLPDIGKRPEQDKVITIDLLSLPPAAPAVVQQVAPSRARQEPAPQRENIAQKEAEQEVNPVSEPVVKPAPTEVVEEPPGLPVVAPSTPKKVVQKKEVRSEPVAQKTPVSLQPLKRKKKLAEDIRLAEEKERAEREKQQERERIVAQEKKRLAEQRKQEKAAERERKLAARKKKEQEAAAQKRRADQRRKEREVAEAARLAREAERAAEQARLEAAQMRREYASVAQAVSDLNTPLSTSNSGYSSGGQGRLESSGVYGGYGSQRTNPAVLDQYGVLLKDRISSHWQLPEVVKTKSNLRTLVALTVGQDGSIKDMRIERESGDSFFDQSVIKALRSSAPLPDFPKLIDKPTLEFALDFTPKGLTL